ncbi:MAG: D-alanyl-D-alanine carboxypeptidase/D-alanyl-D-alanine-endopeptidase (penicillin-binding protein 4) [Myxococcota bacterium]|jgi:D-alanyl-D-alanine carboxypeptidase/D-alanyl-D-alanine-endopeptidase (penicillin-binding protein 4)
MRILKIAVKWGRGVALAIAAASVLFAAAQPGFAANPRTSEESNDKTSESSKGTGEPHETTRTRALDRVLSTKGLAGATVSALVVRERDGAVLYQRAPDRLQIPASNAKILTALAALDAFGPTHQFETELRAIEPVRGDGSITHLYVRGAGDPAITNEGWWRLAAELREAGLTHVKGDLVLDDSHFDRVRWHPTVKGVSSRAYHAPVGALNANYGSFAVTVRPGKKVGDPALVIINPPTPYLELSNGGTTLGGKRRRTIVVDRKAGEQREVVTIRGGMRVGDKPKTYYRSVVHPERYAGAVLRMQLAAVGIRIDGVTRTGVAPEAAEIFHSFKGKPMSDIVKLFMKYSNNGIAEALVKQMGAAATEGIGSWEAGVPEMRKRLIERGVDGSGFELVDGSGLSYHDRASPRAFVQALRAALKSFTWGPELLASLPIAARDGTLTKRAEKAMDRARAKTGLLNNVTGLSGLAHIRVPGREGVRELVVFSVLANDCRQGDAAAMDGLDDFVALLANGNSD